MVALAAGTAWLSVKYVPAAGAATAVALVMAWRRGQRRAATVAVGALGALGALWAAAHVAWYGGLTPYASGEFFASNGGQLAVMGDHPDRVGRTVRLLGLIVDRDFGLAAWQPAWLLLVPAVAVLVARRPSGSPLLVAPLAVGWAMATWVAVTMHGWWFPGRHVVHILPVAVLAVAWWLDRLAAGPVIAWAGAALGVLSSAWLASQTAFGGVTLVFDPWATTDPVLHVMRPLLPDLRGGGTGAAIRYAGSLLTLLVVTVMAVRHELRRRAGLVLDDVVPEPVS